MRTGEVLDVDEAGAKFWLGKEKCWQRYVGGVGRVFVRKHMRANLKESGNRLE